MGRYISGDLDGKCWFGVQDSNFADRFGVEGSTDYISYCYGKEHLDGIKAELKRIEEKWGEDLKKIGKFFDKHECYTHDDLNEFMGFDTYSLLRDYADYKFGQRLADYLEENDYCCFDVEL